MSKDGTRTTRLKHLRRVAKDQARIIMSQQARIIAERTVAAARIKKLEARLRKKRWPWWRRWWIGAKARKRKGASDG